MLPFKQEDYFFNDTHLIKDEELIKQGRYDPDANIYDIDEDLLFFRGKDKPKEPKMQHFEHEKWHSEEFIASPGGIGSNCWAVSGKHTASGKPYLSCDPHLNKQLQSMWYLVNLSWKRGVLGKPGYIVGGSVPGMPMFTYGRSHTYAWGVTALNPDNTDLYVEKIEGDKYFFDGQWY